MFKRKGNIGIIVLVMLIVSTISLNSLVILNRKTTSIKRYNIHNAVVAANLASYSSVVQGNKNLVLSITPYQLKSYIRNPNTIKASGYATQDIVNNMTSEYFSPEERYKSIYLLSDASYSYFKQYLTENLNLINVGSPYEFYPTSESNIGDIKSLKVEEYETYNAIYKDISGTVVSNTVLSENRIYSGIHLKMTATSNRDINFRNISGTISIPIHLDTQIVLYRPTIVVE